MSANGSTSKLRTAPPWVAFGVIAIAACAVSVLRLRQSPPTWLDAHVTSWTNDRYDGIVARGDLAWLIDGVCKPIASALRSAYNAVLWLLRTLRWPGVLAAVFAIGRATGGLRVAAVATASLGVCAVLKLWDNTMQTLALMIVSVAISLLIGVPLGIWAGLNKRVDRVLRTFLDAAQVMPVYVYLLPVIVFFGIQAPAAILATVIFAVAPAVRLTSLGIRNVPAVASEVGTAFGCTRRQLLRKVLLPMARRPILAGLNQVIMMGFGIVVIAALVGTGGLGQDVLSGLQKVNVGGAFEPGLALVFAAIALDRITAGTGGSWTRCGSAISVLGVVGAAVVAKITDTKTFPSWGTIDVARPVNDATQWAQEHLRRGVPLIGGTASVSDFIVRDILNPVRGRLTDWPWWFVLGVVALIAWRSGGPKLAAVCTACFLAIAGLRVWELAMDTLSQVLVAVVLSVALAVPIGVLAARSDWFDRLLRPLLDAAQVMPAFVYLVPVIFLFNVGRVPGVIASVIYALPPGIRLTNLGLRGVPESTLEAARSFGTTRRQLLVKVQLPLAVRSVMLGINQTILMVLSMVVIAALIGGGALGLETIYGLTKKEIGRGLTGGLAIVALAIALDRLTQAWARPETAGPH